MSGPLTGLGVVEFAGLGPAPLAGQLLADLGASVICIDRKSGEADPTDINRRNKQSIALNLKSTQGVEIAKAILARADVLIEGFRPGVMEQLGLGPADLHARLIYGRMTGWGQDGPLARTAGHDINYLAVTGALHAIGLAGHPPVPPLNLVADFGGGAMFLLLGVLSALYERERSGKGQVVDAAMTDGVPAMMALIHMLRARGEWEEGRARNLLDGGAPFYGCYECADGKYVSVGAIEPQFFSQLIEKLELSPDELERQHLRDGWPLTRARYAALFRQKSRDDWSKVFEGADACVTPVLTMEEAVTHSHNSARDVFFELDGIWQAAPAPRFSRTKAGHPVGPGAPGADAAAILAAAGFDADQIRAFEKSGALS